MLRCQGAGAYLLYELQLMSRHDSEKHVKS